MIKGLLYSFHVIFHPFDGFWDLKNEKRGNIANASVFILLTLIVVILKQQLTGFEFNDNYNRPLNIFLQIALVLIPLILWCVTNWSVTTLMDGEGTFKDIYITTAYALVPFIIGNLVLIVLSNIISVEEGQVYSLIGTICIVWSVFLLVIGIMTIHQFTMAKTIGTILLVILGMMIISFLILLFFALIQQLINFFYLLFREILMKASK